jgi:hypothetical protein
MERRRVGLRCSGIGVYGLDRGLSNWRSYGWAKWLLGWSGIEYIPIPSLGPIRDLSKQKNERLN